MAIHIETERFIIRDLEATDAPGIFALDSDPDVHEFLGKQPISTLKEAEQIIAHVHMQYEKNGIGRWAIIEKATGEFVGWTGLKWEEHIRDFSYYDLGYRLRKQYWGQGIATETSLLSLQYGFKKLKLDTICAAAEGEHVVSNHILKKVGFSFVEEFEFEGVSCNFYSLDKKDWEALDRV